MSRETQALLEAFDHLPAEEKRAFTEEVLRRSLPFDSGPLADEEISAASDALWQSLDEEDGDARRGEVWLIDFGQAGKTRPALVVSVAVGDQDRALIPSSPTPPVSAAPRSRSRPGRRS
jgi:hypothetical protein